MNIFKRLASSLTASAMLLTMAPAAFAAGADTGFTDVPSNVWYAEAVQYVTDNGLMSGTGNNQFSPNAATTRGMLMTVLARNAGTDTSDSSPWYQAGMDWAKENGVSDGSNPTGNITRAQLVTMMWRYAGSPTADAGEDFADESTIPSYAAAAVDWAHANGVVNGTSGNRFAPQAGATRAQVATILRNYLAKDQNNQTPDTGKDSKALVAYYSATGSTKAVAETIANELNADLFEITPVTPYTSADLNWNTEGSRVNREHENEALRDIALTQTTPANWSDYDTVFIGYPIWWGIAAWPVNNFVKENDFTGKTVIPFATSASSGMGQSGELLRQMANGGTWQSGQRFSSGASDSTVRSWADGLEIGK